MNNSNQQLIKINRKTFFSVLIILTGLLVITIGLTYLLPKGVYEEIDQIWKYRLLDDQSGIPILQGIFAPILVLFSESSLKIIILLLFLMTISGSFQVIGDSQGINIIINRLIKRFGNRHYLLMALITLLFMLFGSLLGLFEEVLTLLPVIIALVIALGYDPYLAFLVCIVATGYGFASALTNPFTIILASNEAGANVMSGIFFRLVTFAIMYGLLILFIFNYMRKNRSDQTLETTQLIPIYDLDDHQEKKVFRIYSGYLLIMLVIIIGVSSIEAIRDYMVLFLIAFFLIGGVISGVMVTKSYRQVFKSYLTGMKATIPAVFIILLATSIHYVLKEGNIQDSVTHYLEAFLKAESYSTLLVVLVIVLVLEFFISSSTAKAVIVIGVLKGVFVTQLGYTSELLVLIYTYGDGFTNVIFPTSPVLLISLAICQVSYGTWLKRSWWLVLLTLLLVISLICIAYRIGY